MRADDMMELLSREEPLAPELATSLRWGPLGLTLHHPLVVEMFVNRDKAALINAKYQHKLRARDAAALEGNWHSYVFLHERPYRLDALTEALVRNMPREQLPELARDVWTDSENIHEQLVLWRQTWIQVLAIPNPERELRVAALPERAAVWRGAHRHPRKGLSWTTDKERAKWFARRLAEPGEVRWLLSGTALRHNVIDTVADRGEREIIAFKVQIEEQEEIQC